jgi:hypothetical protein
VGSTPTGKLKEDRYESKAPEDVIENYAECNTTGIHQFLLHGLLNSLIGLSTIEFFLGMLDSRIRSESPETYTTIYFFALFLRKILKHPLLENSIRAFCEHLF